MWDPELGDIDGVIERALVEDLGAADVTSYATIPEGTLARARLVAKAPLVVCGMSVLTRVFSKVDPRVEIAIDWSDGEQVASGAVVGHIEGDARALLGAERTALNFVQRMSGTATLTRRYVEAAAGRCRITDTRKTTPGLRALQRYAVRCGGGHNHRNDLASGVLIKENHIRCAGGIGPAIAGALQAAPHTLRIECEVTGLDELAEAVGAGADVVMLDNMSDADIRRAVEWVAGRCLVEVSGGITLERVSVLAKMGVDLISVGALTHSAPAADLSLLVEVGAC